MLMVLSPGERASVGDRIARMETVGMVGLSVR
jgi:hypothetical protein